MTVSTLPTVLHVIAANVAVYVFRSARLDRELSRIRSALKGCDGPTIARAVAPLKNRQERDARGLDRARRDIAEFTTGSGNAFAAHVDTMTMGRAIAGRMAELHPDTDDLAADLDLDRLIGLSERVAAEHVAAA